MVTDHLYVLAWSLITYDGPTANPMDPEDDAGSDSEDDAGSDSEDVDDSSKDSSVTEHSSEGTGVEGTVTKTADDTRRKRSEADDSKSGSKEASEKKRSKPSKEKGKSKGSKKKGTKGSKEKGSGSERDEDGVRNMESCTMFVLVDEPWYNSYVTTIVSQVGHVDMPENYVADLSIDIEKGDELSLKSEKSEKSENSVDEEKGSEEEGEEGTKSALAANRRRRRSESEDSKSRSTEGSGKGASKSSKEQKGNKDRKKKGSTQSGSGNVNVDSVDTDGLDMGTCKVKRRSPLHPDLKARCDDLYAAWKCVAGNEFLMGSEVGATVKTALKALLTTASKKCKGKK